MMKKPFFSVIIPTYNRKEFLKIAIDSVLSQSYPDYELIIVDDGSTDETMKTLDAGQWAPDVKNKIKYLRQRHQGVSEARNNGIRTASGEFICFLDSDDRFRNNKLAITHKNRETS